jgi:drug/metabolite transporter (DMT)-like permease
MEQIMTTKLRGNLMLFLTALIWGVSFVSQKAGMEYIGPYTFNGVRFLVGSAVLIPVILALDGIQKKKDAAVQQVTVSNDEVTQPAAIRYERKDLLLGGISCGIVLFIASSLQQIGILYTTAGKAGFITALYIVLVPILGLLFGSKVRPILWFCVAMAAAGLYLLCVKEDFTIGRGDLLVIACALGFAIHILVIDHFSPKVDGVKMSCIQFFIAGVLSLPFMVIFETIDWSNIFACWLPILYSGVMSCGVAYTLQIVGQKYTEPTVASLILSLESVFAVIAGIILLGEQVPPRELLGCAVMFAAILLAQLPSKEERITNIEKV